MNKNKFSPAVYACAVGLSFFATFANANILIGQSSKQMRSQTPQSAWLNQPAQLNWVASISAQAAESATFYDLSLAVPLFSDFNQINDLNLLFINRLVYGQTDEPFQYWDGSEYDDYFAFETAVRMNIPLTNQFHLFVEGGIDSGRLIFGEILDVDSSHARRSNGDYEIDYTGAVGFGYSQVNWGINLSFRHRSLHFNQDYSQNLVGLELAYGF
ncbi:hypothetical protein N7931_15730 [Catenovulum sp. 2E275]|uniref:hypothetical protein n=1 Tax=Catenovulum sp. 2E275 TaxID=2980497 RepID=UPI0021D341B5|nr:hypothetical protein [Catenovulum sp. 2E275]MCU4677084.1 hypothetical protein [Catenovulum sp. 2E275]